MEEQWFAARQNLRLLLQQRPEWSYRQLAQALNMSVGWVKKWKRRLRGASPDNQLILQGLSHIPKQRPLCLDPLIVERILDIRDHPPHGLRRVPGPRTIVGFLKEDKVLAASGLTPPNSTSTVWKVLCQYDRIKRQKRDRHHQQIERPPVLKHWQMDFKDASSVNIEPGGKKQHVVEVLNVIDVGSSILIESIVREDFNAQTVIPTLAAILKSHGLPESITFDRDPRFVGSASGRDFPSAMVRMWYCLDVEVNICPPHRPDLNGFVERFHRAQGSECLDVKKPREVGEVREAVAEFKEHYNYQRPHQGVSCHDQPPRVAFPELPALRGVPFWVNPDRWLERVNGVRFVRKVRKDGWIEIDKRGYYIGTDYGRKYVTVEVAAPTQRFVVYHQQQKVKELEIKGLHKRPELEWEEYVQLVEQEAISEIRRSWAKAHPVVSE